MAKKKFYPKDEMKLADHLSSIAITVIYELQWSLKNNNPEEE